MGDRPAPNETLPLAQELWTVPIVHNDDFLDHFRGLVTTELKHIVAHISTADQADFVNAKKGRQHQATFVRLDVDGGDTPNASAHEKQERDSSKMPLSRNVMETCFSHFKVAKNSISLSPRMRDTMHGKRVVVTVAVLSLTSKKT